MALRDQPYFPLYVQDYLTDEKLNLCSYKTQGIYIKIMCILHKSEPYGCILLKQKDKQKGSKCLNFAYKIAKLLPIQVDDLSQAINELVEEGCLLIEDDKLYQKRMVKDNDISIKRSKAGKKGGKFAQAKVKANYEDENENENENRIVIEYLNKRTGKNFRSTSAKTKKLISARINEGFTTDDFKTVIENKCIDWENDLKMSEYLRPETLFGTKFESYLNKKTKRNNDSDFD